MNIRQARKIKRKLDELGWGKATVRVAFAKVESYESRRRRVLGRASSQG